MRIYFVMTSTAYNNINRENSKLFINTYIRFGAAATVTSVIFFTNVRLLYQNLDLYRLL